MQVKEYLTHPEQWQITEREVSPSTNTELKQLALRGAPHGTVLTAARQTAGRGRLGRSFYSPEGTGLYLSVLLRPEGTAEQATRITPTAAVAVRRAVLRTCGRDLKIKWVNDLYRDGKKVCGILTEGEPDPESGGLRFAVCGIGINLCPPKEGFPEALQSIAGSITDTPDPTLRPRLAAAILEELETGLHRPWNEILEEYRAHSLLTGKTVVSPTGSFQGTATVLGIDETGGLRIALSDGRELTLTGGEVSVREV